MKSLRVLIAIDTPDDASQYAEALRGGNYNVLERVVTSLDQAKATISSERFEIILSEHKFSGGSGIDLLKAIDDAGIDIPLILISDHIGEEASALAFKQGIGDLIFKDDLRRLPVSAARLRSEVENRKQKREAENALRENEERLQLALAAAEMGVWEWDLKSDDIFWSPECSRIFGVEIAAARSADVLNWILPEDRLRVEEKYRRAIEKGGIFNDRFRIKRKRDGQIAWLLQNGKCVFDEGTNVPAKIVGTLRDVTSEQEASQAIREAEERYRVIAESASDAVVSIGEDGLIQFANIAAKRIFGYSAKELIGSPLTRLMPERFREQHQKGMARYMSTGVRNLEWRGTELTGITKDGRELTLQVSFGEHLIANRRVFTGYMSDVTAERAAINKIRESEKEFRALVEVTSKYVWKLDDTGNMISDQDLWTELTGQPADAAGDLGWLEFVHPEDRDDVQATFERMVAEKTAIRTDMRILRRDGEYGHYVARGVPVKEEECFRWICALTDVTKRRRAEAALTASESRLANLVNSVEGIVWEADAETFEFTFVSDQAEVILGYPIRKWFEPKFWVDHIFEEDRQAAVDYCVSSTEKGLSHTFEYRMVAANGKRVWLRDIANVVIDEGSGRKMLRGLMVDVTQVKERAANLARQALVIEQASEAILAWDMKRGILEWNKGCEKLYGFTRSEVRGKLPYEVLQTVFPTDVETFRGELQEKRMLTGLVEQLRKDKRKVTVEASYQVIKHEGREIVLQTNRDITDRLATEKALRESEGQLQQVQKLESIGTLAGGMAHDFNNMLTAINGYSDLILRKIGKDDPIRANVEEIRKAGERSSDLTKALLAFSRRQIMQPRVLDLNSVIEEILSMLRRLINEEIEIVTQLAPDLWNVEADPGQISQVLVNLAVNARDAMPDGGTLTIETRNDPSAEISENGGGGGYVRLSVTDTGSGMDEATRLRAFEPFFTTKGIGHGTGLGLSTVFGIVNQSGGKVRLDSSKGSGTSIEIVLPAVKA